MNAKTPFTMPFGIPVDVCNLFEKLTLDLINAGWSHYSADAVLHRIRWHYHVDQGNRTFKANDHWTSALARWFMDVHPSTRGFFRTRRLRSAAMAAVVGVIDRPEDHEDYPFD